MNTMIIDVKVDEKLLSATYISKERDNQWEAGFLVGFYFIGTQIKMVVSE